MSLAQPTRRTARRRAGRVTPELSAAPALGMAAGSLMIAAGVPADYGSVCCMSMFWAELRFLRDRGAGLLRRGLTSVRTRGFRASLERALVHFRPLPRSPRPDLYLPGQLPFAPFTVPCADSPHASIVIPVFNELRHTLACLRTLAAHPPHLAAEIIVVDDR